MGTIQEQLLKAEHDARVAAAKADDNRATIDYLAMMADIEIPTDEEVPADEPEL